MANSKQPWSTDMLHTVSVASFPQLVVGFFLCDTSATGKDEKWCYKKNSLKQQQTKVYKAESSRRLVSQVPRALTQYVCVLTQRISTLVFLRASLWLFILFTQIQRDCYLRGLAWGLA